MARDKWSEWSADYVGAWGGVSAGPVIPAEEVSLTDASDLVSSLPPAIAGPTLTFADQAGAATAISHEAAAWPVVIREWRRRLKDGLQDCRRRRIGWLVRTTRYSRWEGEGVTHDWSFVPGSDPGLSRRLDLRWGDPVESHRVSGVVDLKAVLRRVAHAPA